MPGFSEKINFYSKADMFCVYAVNNDILQEFIRRFRAACDDTALMKDLFSRAELDEPNE